VNEHSNSAEAQISEEIEEVQAEADEIEAGWGEKIWRLASELRQVFHTYTHVDIHIYKHMHRHACMHADHAQLHCNAH
jgi:predicted sugar kinase